MAWFQRDDFVWLNLPNLAHGWDGLLYTLFQPTVQGTWRPLSERAFFLAFGAMFGADALPYHIWIFLTIFADLALLQSLAVRLTGWRAAGFWTAILWATHSKLATVMSWTCEYILAACAFFLLLALHLFLRFIETGRRRYYVWTWIAFLTGFLAMETNIVFPLLAAGYTLARARSQVRRTLPFLAASAVYGILHLLLAPNRGTVPYTMHFDHSIPLTFLSYWRRVFEPIAMYQRSAVPPSIAKVGMVACSLALLGFAIYQARRKQPLALLLLAWFAITLAPVIPLRGHITDYYLTLPLMWLAMLGGYALVCAWRAGPRWRLLGLALTTVFLLLQLPVGRRTAQWYREQADAQRSLVMGVARAHELHPGKVILLDGINDVLFWGGVQQRPFLFLQIPDVYLAPGSEKTITPHPEIDEVSRFVLPVRETRRALDRDRIVVYRAGKGPLQNITHKYVLPAAASGPLRLDVGDPLAADRLGPQWYPVESGIRWMPRTASLTLPGPPPPGARLFVTATCPAAQLRKGPLEMTLRVGGIRLAPVQFTESSGETTFAFDLPASTAGKADIDVTVEVSRTIQVSGDGRDLGLVFGRFEIR